MTVIKEIRTKTNFAATEAGITSINCPHYMPGTVQGVFKCANMITFTFQNILFWLVTTLKRKWGMKTEAQRVNSGACLDRGLCEFGVYDWLFNKISRYRNAT